LYMSWLHKNSKIRRGYLPSLLGRQGKCYL